MMTTSRRGASLISLAIGTVWAGVVGAGAVSMMTGESVCGLVGACDAGGSALVMTVADPGPDAAAASGSKNTAFTKPAPAQCSAPADAACAACQAKTVNAAQSQGAPADAAASCAQGAGRQATTTATTAAFAPINATCPGSGKPIDAAVTTVSHGFTVGFCCTKCKAKFDAAPATLQDAYIIQHARVINDTCPTCPTMKPSATAVSLVDGFAVGFCNKDCQKTFEAKDDAAKAAYIASIVKPVNTTCPNSGKPVDSDAVAIYRGVAVGYCGQRCLKDFNAKSTAEKDAVVAQLAHPNQVYAKPAAAPAQCAACKDGAPCAECAKKAAAKGTPAE